MSRPRKFLALRATDRALLLEACWNLAVACVCLRVVPFRWSLRGLHVCSAEPQAVDLSPDQFTVARRIRWIIRLAARHVPWRAVCLPQSLAARMMLERRGIPVILYLGVRKSIAASPSFETHAWVCAGILEVTPRQAREAGQPDESLVVIAMFKQRET
jgi:Transglutaminase-like superfamily